MLITTITNDKSMYLHLTLSYLSPSVPTQSKYGTKRKREEEKQSKGRRSKRERFAQNCDGQIDGFSFRESWLHQLISKRPKKK